MSKLPAVSTKYEILSDQDLEVLRNSKFKGFTDHEIAYCAKVIRQLNLSPFLNQIHFIKRKLKDGSAVITTQVGIDGFRLSAQRAGGYAGSDEPVVEYTDKEKRYPSKVTVTVYRMVDGQRCPFTASARWEEYYPGDATPNSFMWKKMPHNMLAKCAEALALRKACPAELSSIYAEEEMHQAQQERISPEHPDEGDGFDPPANAPYRVPGGQYAKRGLHEVDPKELRNYIVSREKAIEKNPTKEPFWWADFVQKAEIYLADLENQPLEEEAF